MLGHDSGGPRTVAMSDLKMSGPYKAESMRIEAQHVR